MTLFCWRRPEGNLYWFRVYVFARVLPPKIRMTVARPHRSNAFALIASLESVRGASPLALLARALTNTLPGRPSWPCHCRGSTCKVSEKRGRHSG